MRNQMTYEIRGQSTSSAGVLTESHLRALRAPGTGRWAAGPASGAGGAHDLRDRQCSDF